MPRIFTEARREARDQKALNKKLTKMATAQGVELSSNRLDRLAGNAKILGSLSAEDRKRISFVQDGLTVDPPARYRDKKSVSGIDFMPTLADGVRASKSQRHMTTKLSLDALHALQDYTLLVDGGYLEKPNSLSNYTNKEMRMVAERAGFTPVPQVQGFVTAEYDVMQAALFSPETFRVEAVLMQRQERLQAALGQIAGQ